MRNDIVSVVEGKLSFQEQICRLTKRLNELLQNMDDLNRRNPDLNLLKPLTLTGLVNSSYDPLEGAEIEIPKYFVTPEEFGAVGDGIHDDTEAINKAMNASNTVILNAKTYGISKTLTIPNNVLLIGFNAINSKITALSNFSGEELIHFEGKTGGLKNLYLFGDNKKIKGLTIGKVGNSPVIAKESIFINNLFINGCKSGGLEINSIYWQLMLHDILIFSALEGTGLKFYNDDSFIHNLVISDCFDGLKVKGGANKFSAVKIDQCLNTGLIVENGYRNNYTDLEIQEIKKIGLEIKQDFYSAYENVFIDSIGPISNPISNSVYIKIETLKFAKFSVTLTNGKSSEYKAQFDILSQYSADNTGKILLSPDPLSFEVGNYAGLENLIYDPNSISNLLPVSLINLDFNSIKSNITGDLSEPIVISNNTLTAKLYEGSEYSALRFGKFTPVSNGISNYKTFCVKTDISILNNAADIFNTEQVVLFRININDSPFYIPTKILIDKVSSEHTAIIFLSVKINDISNFKNAKISLSVEKNNALKNSPVTIKMKNTSFLCIDGLIENRKSLFLGWLNT